MSGVQTGVLEFLADEQEQLLRARLENIVQHARRDGARRAIADAGDFDAALFTQQRRARRSRSCA